MTAEDRFAQAWQHHQTGNVRQAEEDYRAILRTEPRNGRVWFVLGNLCADQDRLPEAVACIRQAVEIEPREPMGWLHLGIALMRQKKPTEAEEAFRQCLQLPPGREGTDTQATALVNLGFLLGEQEKLAEARDCYEKAIRLRPNLAEAHHNLGNVLREQGLRAEALARYDEALRLQPDYAKAHINKGIALVAGGDIEPALVCLRRALEIQPTHAEARNSLGTILAARGQVEDALAEYERAIALMPDYAEAHWNRALVRLLQGDYARGWPDYEWRWRCQRAHHLPNFTQARWDGSPLEGRTILLYAEQGLGDTLHFVRYAPLVKARGGKVILQCQSALIPLLSRCAGIDGIVPWGTEAPPFDVYAALMSLPALFGTTLETIPAEVPYLHADPALVEHWCRQLAVLPGYKVGIAWQGSTVHAWDRHRSVALEQFAPLAAIPGVRLISLQKGPAAEQVQAVAGRFHVADFGELVDRTSGAFMDTAALLHGLDLVITVDTALAHLAGGLGLPVWLALHHVPDWRWLRGRGESPWYPSARLFRQPAPRDWSAVFQDMAAALRERINQRERLCTWKVDVSAGELVDKLSILRIKARRLTAAGTPPSVRSELDNLQAARGTVMESAELLDYEQQLATVNDELWEMEDSLRNCEQEKDFGPRFIELARSACRAKDRRSALKQAIDALLPSNPEG